MMEQPKIPDGPPHGGPYGDGHCCGYRTYDRKLVEENRGQWKSIYRWFVVGTWQCHHRYDHNGELTPTPIVI